MNTKPVGETEAILLYIDPLPQGTPAWKVSPPKSLRHYYRKKFGRDSEKIRVTNSEDLMLLIHDITKKKMKKRSQKSG